MKDTREELIYQTRSNCLSLGYEIETANQIIKVMRKNEIPYINRKLLSEVQSFKRFSDNRIIFPIEFIRNIEAPYHWDEQQEIQSQMFEPNLEYLGSSMI